MGAHTTYSRAFVGHPAAGALRALPRRAALSLIALGAGAAACMSGPSAAAPVGEEVRAGFAKIPKAVWIWRTPLAEAGSIAGFMESWAFDTALMSVPPAQWSELEREPGALSPLRAVGRRVLLACGDPNWAQPVRTGLPDPLVRVMDLAAQSGAAGLALDVEPHVLPAWRGDGRGPLARGFLSLLRSLKGEMRARRLELWVAVHPSHATTAAPDDPSRSVFEAALPHTDHVVTMAYRNEPAAAVEFAAPLLASLARSGTPWHFGVTTQPGEKARPYSYGAASADAFCRAMTTLDRALRASGAAPGYRGLAVHHFAPTAAILS